MSLFEIDGACIKQREYVNIPAWHNKGYTGEGITVFCDDTKTQHHAEKVADIMQIILPKARVLTGNIGYTIKDGIIKSARISCTQTGEILAFDEFIEKYDISSINNSKGGNKGIYNMPESIFMAEKIKEYNLLLTGAAGNINEGYIENVYLGAAIIVGSANLINNRPVYGMKAIGEGIDFVMFRGWESGTSFSAPFLNAMGCLLRCKYGRQLTQNQIYSYFKNHSKDMRTEGKDVYTGWGLPIMGDAQTVIKMQLGKKVMTVDNCKIEIDQEPMQIKKTNRTVVPIRAIAEAFGAEVIWDEKTKTVTIIK